MADTFLMPRYRPITRSGNDANTKLLLHMDGANGGAVFTDSSASPYTLTRTGTPTTSTVQSKFGGASGLFSGAASQYLNLTDTGKLDFGTGNFCIDFWAYPTAIQNANVLSGNNTNDWQIAMSTGGSNFYSAQRGVISYVGSPVIPINAWTHVAFQRVSGVQQVWTNGVLGATIAGGQTLNISGAFRIGELFAGYLEEIRVSNVARYTKNFFPPTAAY